VKSGGIDNGARVTTVNSSGASRVSPNVRDKPPALQPPNKTMTVAGAISRIGVDKWLMARLLLCPVRAAQDVHRDRFRCGALVWPSLASRCDRP
jgi:hypothetical protein